MLRSTVQSCFTPTIYRSKMKIIVTGGAGFIGSAVVRQYINDTKHEVINLDALTYAGNLESLKEIDQSPRYLLNMSTYVI